MIQSASDLNAAIRALAEPHRRTILTLVAVEPLAVGEIAELVPLTQQAVSQHLRILRDAGLLIERRDGTRHLFTVRPEGFSVVREFLDRFWPARLAALKQAAEAEARRGAVEQASDG